ncbi:MAG: nickel pincer cofactor biosynthesis protein LarB [candidate division Zixibacteria bacterium]|nr:nickel pincer cofactor biosynthesis protein LarB [candidate division Zixibacteria bacterium]
MKESDIKKLLEEFEKGKISKSAFIRKLKIEPYENLEFARVDYHRKIRIGIPEVIFCGGKSLQQISDIIKRMQKNKHPVLATRVEESTAKSLKKKFPKGKYNKDGRTFVIKASQKSRKKVLKPLVSIISAGTSDMPVAEEARETLEFLGVPANCVYDVGVAGLHRFLGEEKKLEAAKILIVVAGMEGALASVVGGLYNKPIIAVPTSIGYGTSFSGLSPLLSMLNACSSGISVVNIDNGFGAACAAFRIIRTLREDDEDSDI